MKTSTLLGIMTAISLAAAFPVIAAPGDGPANNAADRAAAREQRQEARQAAQEQIQQQRAARQEARQQAQEQRQAAGDAKPRKAATGDATPVVAKAQTPSDRRENQVDRREARQEHRISEGVKHGQLTPDETAKLQKQEDNINSLEKQFESDGKLSKEEGHKLNQELNEASMQIWAERHDTEGNQKPVSRLGRDIFANDELTKQIESGELTRAQARQFLGDFRQMTNLKRRLASDNLSDTQRVELQAKYNDLLNKYFHTA